MADPHHVAVLDGLDRGTVAAYRLGIGVAAAGVGASAWELGSGGEPVGGRWLTLVGVALIVANLHLYDRTIRWVIGAAGWIGAVLVGSAAVAPARLDPWLVDAGLGFSYVVLSAVALKERYCFRLPIVVAIPPLLAGALVPLRLGAGPAAAAMLGAAAAALAALFVGKLRMPLRYDIGDKSRYQV